MLENLYLDEVITSVWDLSNGYVFRNGFAFTSIDEPTNVYDAIIIRHPVKCNCWSPKTAHSYISPEEHIELINKHKIEKAKIIAEDISFITQCPSLKYLDIIPADTAPNNFDYSPLYAMPEIRSLCCRTLYGGSSEPFSTTVDLSKINGLRLADVGKGCLNFEKATSLERIHFSGYKELKDLKKLCNCKELKRLTFLSCSLKSLDGAENLPKLQGIDVWYNRQICDISALRGCAESLRWLSLQNCPKITDFSYLSVLKNLEAVSLEGNNDLPDVDFLRNMKNIKWFICTMNVINGDLTPCLSVPYVDIKGRKHYNLKNKDLPKNGDKRGFIWEPQYLF